MTNPPIPTNPPKRNKFPRPILYLLSAILSAQASAGVGDPQLKTQHPWYPGELACSTFPRLFQTQAALYKRVTGRDVTTDEDKALASWYWRNLHYVHGEEGKSDCFDQGFTQSDWTRDYWTGLFAHGFGLCGTTHAQFTAELNHLLGHARARTVGVTDHNTLEVFLKGGAYGEGKWALLDQDQSCVIFSPDGSRLLSIPEIIPHLKQLADPDFQPARQRGWRIDGLHRGDSNTYTSVKSVEHFPGYAGPPPLVHLRKGESLRRYLNPGLDDGQTFVFWGMNYNTANIPGPERSNAWVNQPEKMFGAQSIAPYRKGQWRFANAVYTYQLDFSTDAYKDGIIDESPNHVTFEFYTPYVIACTPPNNTKWGIYDQGGTNGLVLHGTAQCDVSISTDQGKTWSPAFPMKDGLDLTDLVKGHQQYFLRFHASPEKLKSTNLRWRTVCQANVATMPRLTDGMNQITFQATGHALLSAGPNKDQANAHVVAGGMNQKSVTLQLHPPRGEKAVRLYASSWQNSGNPPADVAYHIDYSTDQGKTWRPVVKDWRILRRDPEPKDFWSQSFSWGDVPLDGAITPIQVRFSNTGNKTYRKVEAHLIYEANRTGETDVTFAWKNTDGPPRTASHRYSNVGTEDATWQFDAGSNVETLWVDFAAR